MTRWLFAMFLCAVSVSAQAGQFVSDLALLKVPVCGDRRIVTINGIATTQPAAFDNMGALRAQYGNSLDDYRVLFSMAYNRTGWWGGDLQQSYAQILAAYPSVTFQDWLTAVWTGIFGNSIPVSAAAQIGGAIGNLIGMQRPDPQQDADMAVIIQDMRGIYNPPNDRILMVPHSQGNIYAVKVWDRFTTTPLPPAWPDRFAKPPLPPQTIGMVGVASVVPAMRNGDYLTSDHDAVVGGVRLAFPVLANNTPIAYSPFADILGHNFRNIYMQFAGPSITVKVDSAMRALRPAGPFPPTLGTNSVGIAYTCTPTAPCYVGTQVYKEPIISYPVAGSGSGGALRPGSASELDALLATNLRQCNDLLVAQRKQLGSNSYSAPSIPGCTDSYWSSYSGGSWVNYSADSTSLSFEDAGDYSYMSPPQQYRRARLNPVCQPG